IGTSTWRTAHSRATAARRWYLRWFRQRFWRSLKATSRRLVFGSGRDRRSTATLSTQAAGVARSRAPLGTGQYRGPDYFFFGGNDEAYAEANLTHFSSRRLVRRSSDSTRSQPCIGRPR